MVFSTVMATRTLLLVLGVLGARAQNQCMLQDGRCQYHINLSPSCNSNPTLDYNSLQNDYDQRVNEIEKNLIDVRIDHAKRIEELENRISNMGALPNTGENSEASTQGTTHKNRHRKFSVADKQKEDDLLIELHNQFTGLRHELGQCRRRGRDLQSHLREARNSLNRTEVALVQTTDKLIKVEDDLEISRDENMRLTQNVQETGNELNDTKTRLTDTLSKMRKKDLDLWNLQYENDRLNKELQDLQDQLLRTRQHLAEALSKYHELNLAHEETVQTLRNTTESLVTCFKGKTSQFCGFEDAGICGFEHDNNSLLEWARHNGATPSAYTGPEEDNTCRNYYGYYMYVEASNPSQATSRGEDQKATLISPRYAGLGEQCVEFFYHMYGRHAGTLNVYTRISEEDFIQSWRVFGNQGNVWINARLPIPLDVAQKGYQVIFEGILGNGAEGDIAIDDFRVFDGPCYEVPATEPPSNSTQPALPYLKSPPKG